MPVETIIAIAIALAITGIIYAYRSKMSDIWEGKCPQCQMTIWLPLRICPLCGADIESEEYRESINLACEGVQRRKRALLRRGVLLILMACVVLLLAFFMALGPTLVRF